MLHFRIALPLILTAAGVFGSDPTYSREVSRILQEKCQACHRPNDVAPFPLLSYEDAAAQGRSIRSAISHGIMPPWKPIAGHGEFKNNLSLSDDQKQTILDWIDAGMPQGDPADLPEPIQWPDDWRLGKPDLVVNMPEAYTPVPREDRPDRYRCFAIANVTDADRWVRAVDVQPGARQSVHHVILYMTDEPKVMAQIAMMEAEDPDPGYDCWGGPRFKPGAGSGLVKEAGGMLGAWVPGAQPVQYSSEFGVLVPKGTTIVMQVHYNLHDLDGEPQPDRSAVGLYFHEKTPKSRVLAMPVLNDKFILEPGVMGKEVVAEFAIDASAATSLPIPESLMPKLSAISVAPHMHQLGKKIRGDLIQPDGTQVPMVEIDDWDFHWQGFYNYVQPLAMPYRSKVRVTCTFDNTTDRTIMWGESTDDEMCLMFVGFTAEGGLSSLLFGNP